MLHPDVSQWTKRNGASSPFQSVPLVLAMLLIVLLVLGFAPYAGLDFGSAKAQQWLAGAAPGFTRAMADVVNVAAGFAVWDALVVVTAFAAWRLRARAFAGVLVQGLSIEIIAFMAKAMFLAPWILAHAMPVGGYAAAGVDLGPAAVQQAAAPELRFSVNIPAGVYAVRVRLSGDRWGVNSVSLGLDDSPQSSAKGLFVLPDRWWHWSSTGSAGTYAYLGATTPGRHIVNVWARAPGVRIDRLELRLAMGSSSGFGAASDDRREAVSSDGKPLAIVLEAESFDGGIQPDTAIWVRRTGPPDRFFSLILFTIRTADMPSAHVARVLTMLGLAVSFVPPGRRLVRIGLLAGTIVAVAAVICARILSNAHTPLGSVAGGVLGLVWLRWLLWRASRSATAREDVSPAGGQLGPHRDGAT